MGGLLGGLSADVWDGLARNNFYSSSAWLETCARTPGVHSEAVVTEVGGARAAVPVTRFTSPTPATYDPNKLLSSRGLPEIAPPTGVVGPGLGYQTHLLRSAEAPGLIESLVARLREHAAEVADAPEPTCVVAMYLSTSDVRALLDTGVPGPPVLIEPDAWFELPDGGWGPWLASLRKGQRYRVRDDCRRFDAMGYRVTHTGLPACQDRLPPIAVELAKKLGFNADPARFAAQFSRYAAASGDDARVVLCERVDGELVAFSIYYVWGDTVYLRWAAVDYPKVGERNGEYFAVSYYRLIDVAAEAGARYVHLGKKVLDAKVFRGARLRPLWLLDFTPDSPLHGNNDVRKHNANIIDRLTGDPRMVNAIDDLPAWKEFA